MTDTFTAEEAQKLLSQMHEWWAYDHGNLIQRAAAMIEALNAELAAANAREAGLRAALDMAKKHMIVNDLSLPNVFAVIDAALAQPSTGDGE